MKSSLVSVIIPTYKRDPNMVKRAVLSVVNQSHPYIEIIVVDDSPCDYAPREAVKEAVLSLGDNITYIQHEKNMGACAARNTGIKNARGEFLAFLDDDDEWLPTKTEKQLEKFRNREIGLVYCGHYGITESGSKKIFDTCFLKGKVFERLMFSNFVGSTSFVMLRREVVEQAGPFDTSLKSSQDYDMWLRAANVCEFDYVEEPLVHYYVHEGERISTNPKNKIQGLEELNSKYWAHIQNNKELLWRRTIVLAPWYAQDKNYKKAFSLWLNAVKLKPFHFFENLWFLKLFFFM